MSRFVPIATTLLALVLAACPKPTDGDVHIPVSPNLQGRIGLLPSRHRPAKEAAQASANARARAHLLKRGEELGGPNATGKPGDWILENDEVVFVVDAPVGPAGFTESGGIVIDAADARVRKDELGQIATQFGSFPRRAVYAAIARAESADGTAVLTAHGRELLDSAIDVETEYRLGGSDRALLIRTTLSNKGSRDAHLAALGDAIAWGAAERIAPGKAIGFQGPSSGPFLGGVGRLVSYALTTPDGAIDATSGGGWTNTEQQRSVTIGAGKSVTYERVLVVGERPDVASLVAELTKASGGELGRLEVAVVDAAGRAVHTPASAKIVLATATGAEVMSLVVATDDTMFVGELPPGKWVASYAPTGRGGRPGAKIAVETKNGEVAKATLVVTELAKLDASCTEVDAAGATTGARLPCKITIEGIEGTPAPELGPAHASGPAKNQLVAHEGDVSVAPGKYRVTFTRGPEYAAESAIVVLEAGLKRTVSVPLRRVVDTSGYVATDLHQHTALGAVGVRERLLSSAAEAVEVAVVSERNAVADLGDAARDAGVSRFIVALSGDELSSDASASPWGHASVFPMSAVATKPRGGAPVVHDRRLDVVLAELRARGGVVPIVQINHPRSAEDGYFDLLGFDRKTGVGTAAGYDASFDALEVWSGRNVDARTKVLDDYLALLRTSHPVTPIADTDAQGGGAGPRTYVRVSKDDGLETWSNGRTDEIVRSVREVRDVVLTNGPFLRVSANGAGIGAIAAARSGVVEVKVHVATTAFASVDRAELRLAGGGISPSSVALSLSKRASGAFEQDVTFLVRASADDAFVVVVTGSRPVRPMLAGEDREITPWAMSGAIWIDANGDGKALARERVRR